MKNTFPSYNFELVFIKLRKKCVFDKIELILNVEYRKVLFSSRRNFFVLLLGLFFDPGYLETEEMRK